MDITEENYGKKLTGTQRSKFINHKSYVKNDYKLPIVVNFFRYSSDQISKSHKRF